MCLRLATFAGTMMLSTILLASHDAPSPAIQEVVAGNTAFATDLYARLKSRDGNLFFSPYSVSTALAMTYAGARGDTAQQMAKALHFTAPQERLHPAFSDLQTELNAVQKAGNLQISVANSLWPQEEYPFLPEYLGLLKQYYGTSVTSLDYVAAPEAARKTINDWVEQKTNHKITDLIRPGVLNSLTRLVLANAIYFKGDWAKQFDPKLTSKGPFRVSASKDVECWMMYRKGTYAYAETPDLQILQLPYRGSNLCMIVLLPREPIAFGNLEHDLTAAKLAEWLNALHEREIDICLPKFKLTCETRLDRSLASMGMADAFTSRADFSGMDGQKNWLYIGAVLHKAFIDVNEEGTEAAAATAAIIQALGPETGPNFCAVHPFVFLIRDNHTGSILFMGRVVNPAE
jgi:serpin B